MGLDQYHNTLQNNLTMTPSIRVSIIVPVYNREKYLRQCVDSIVAQTLKEIEIILVDDGSTDSSPAICDEYAARDSRVKVIHKQNAGLGAAYNTGMAAAKGEYIGFVEADDWIESEMYEKLYAEAVKQDVDVVKSLFTRVNKQVKKVVNQYGNRYFYQRLGNKLAAAVFGHGHFSTWSAIYRREFLEKYHIRYPERSGASMVDIDFHWRIFTQVRSCYLIAGSYYNYRVDSLDSSSQQGVKTAEGSLLAFYHTFEWLLENDIDEYHMELFYRSSFLSAKGNLQVRCRGVKKIAQAKRISKVFTKYLPCVKFKRFSEQEKKDFLLMLRHPVLYSVGLMIYQNEIKPTSYRKRILGIKLVEIKKTSQYDKLTILYLPIRKEIFAGQGSKISYFGLPLIRTKKKDNVIEKRFLGIRYKTKQNPVNRSSYADDVRMLQIMTHANAITNTHRETFTKYKNCHAGQDVALIATGATLNCYEPLKHCVNIGVNKAALFEKVHFDYLFFQDYQHTQVKEILNIASNCKGTKKFYGILQDSIRQDWIVPESVSIRDGAERYYVISQWKYPPIHFTYDIANEPFGDCGSVSFAAMQFILWTNPRRVYLVGQDITSSYWDRSLSLGGNIANYHRGWKEMEKFAKIYYPDVEIVSINPVGLKGMFKDMYTQSYLREHQEIKAREDDIIGED